MDKIIILRDFMKGKGLRLAVAESLTCGNLQGMIGRVSGASHFFNGGITAYNLDQKVNLLNVDREHAFSVDCVSDRVAYEMAKGICDRMNSDIGIGTTGYAELDSGTPYAHVCVYDRNRPKEKRSKCISMNLDRVSMQKCIAAFALEELYNFLKL